MDRADDALRCAEMRRILTNILGFSEMLADPVLRIPAKSRREYADIIMLSGQHLDQTIGEIRQKVSTEDF